MKHTNLRLSPSKIGLGLDCPRCFNLTVNGLWARPRGIFPSLPGGMDRVTKEFVDKHRRDMLKPADWGLPGRWFENERLLAVWRNPFAGLRYTNMDGDTLFGALDDVIVVDDLLVVVDYKTKGMPVRDDTPEYYTPQLETYAYLLKKNGYRVADYAYLVYFSPEEMFESGLTQFLVQPIKVRINATRAEQRFREALACARGPEPEDSCPYCEYVPRGLGEQIQEERGLFHQLDLLRESYPGPEVKGTVVP